jgi:hypothetical protein
VPDPEYRGKRLQQHIMDALHARAEEEDTLVQVINGINWVRQRAALDSEQNVKLPNTNVCLYSTIDNLAMSMR